MKFLEFAIATVLVCSPLLAEASLIGTTVTGCFDAIPDADVGTRTSCIGNFPQSPATVMNNDPEFLADTQSGLVFADFDSAGPDSTYLDIGLWEPTQGINPTVWEFTGIDWGGTGVIDSFVLVRRQTISDRRWPQLRDGFRFQPRRPSRLGTAAFVLSS
ncbi:MAG: hypothetical protein JRE71_03555, partial [Deltaproteobacteria bacterium]|nr:hypothetical protein [Deltaproteobacteria bacterium]